MANRVEAEGRLDSRYIVVGEAPGKHEIMKGRPFIGPVGKELDNLLHSAGILRDDCYLTNTIKEGLTGSLDTYIENKGRGKFYVSDRFKLYQQELQDEINQCSGYVIIPLGMAALYATTGYGDITKRRGSILYNPMLPGKKIIPTLHPGTIFKEIERTDASKKKGLNGYLCSYAILNDLTRAHDESDSPELNLPQRILRTGPSFHDVMGYIERCETCTSIGFDIETMRTKTEGKFTDWEMSCLALAISPSDVMSIPFVDGGRSDYFTVDKEREIWRALQKLLGNPSISKIIQNATFDMSFVLRKHKIVIENVDDTLIAAAILTPDFPYGLDFLTSVYTREPYYKDEGKQHSSFGKNVRQFWEYNAKDAAVLLEIFPQQKEELKAQGNIEAYEDTRRLLKPLLFIETKGLRANKDGMAKASVAILREAERKGQELKALCKSDINPNSSKDVQTYFYITRGAKPIYKGRQRTITADKDALKKLVKQGYEEARVILDIRRLLKLNSTYMKMTLDLDERIRSAMAPVTVTGRLSSSQNLFGTGGNIQNLPLEFKRYVLAEPGHLAYELDYSQGENRIVAVIAPEPIMAEAFAAKRDVHSLTGSLISGLTYEEVLQQHKNKVCCPLAAGDKSWRFWGKQANHALNYGLGADKFASRYELPIEEAADIVSTYHRAYPGIHQYHSWIQFKLREDRTLTNCLGRSRKFLDKFGPDLFEAAFAQIPQSTIGTLINRRGLLPLYYEQDIFSPIFLSNQVHDSIWFQGSYEDTPLELHAACILALKKYLEQPIPWKGTEFVIPADLKIGLNFGDMIEIDTNCSLEELTNRLSSELSKLLS